MQVFEYVVVKWATNKGTKVSGDVLGHGVKVANDENAARTLVVASFAKFEGLEDWNEVEVLIRPFC